MNEKHLGKIKKVYFGIGGYNDSSLGMFLDFSLDGGTLGVGAYINCGPAPTRIEVGEHTKWTEADREKQMITGLREIDKILAAAKVDRVDRLLSIPIEVTFENNTLKDWRILTEVI